MNIKEQSQQSKIELSNNDATDHLWLLNTWNWQVQSVSRFKCKRHTDLKGGKEDCLIWGKI